MQEFDLREYCLLFLKDERLGGLVFYKDAGNTYTYRDLIHAISNKISELEKSPHAYLALKMESSLNLFVHLLAGSFVKKDLLILSSKEPEKAVSAYQKNISFTEVLVDSPISILANEFPFHTIDMKRVAFNVLSSGSSGPSKAIGLSLHNVHASALSFIEFFEMKETDSTYLNLPHHHIGGLMILWRAFFSMSSVTKNEMDAYNFISLVPLQLKRFLSDTIKKERLAKCRGVLIGGAPLLPELKDEAVKENIAVYETYGMSETSSMVMLNGTPLLGQIIKLDSENRFMIKGPTLSPGVHVDQDGFYHTKDVGVQNPDGSFSFKHRSDVLFKSAGELINPLLIEEKVKTLPWIKEAVVVSVDHPEWTKASVLVYKLSDPTKSADDIKNFLKTELHPYLVPRYFYEASNDLIADGMKPKRFDISQWAQDEYFKEQLHYLYIPNPQAKKLMVFFHGFMEDHTDMIALMDNHKDISFLFIDVPGHGKSKAHKFKSRDDVFYTLSSLINFKKKDLELIVYGYSMGGRIALELASLYLKVDLLILESSHFGLISEKEKETRLSSDRNLLTASDLDLKTFFTNWYKNPIFGNYNQSYHYKNEIEKKYAHDPKEWQASLEFFSPGATPSLQDDTIKRISSLKIVGIAGSDDEKYKTHFLEMKNKLSNFKYFEIKNSGHNPHKTHLSEIKNILREFL